jgi:hypothetical protein
LPSPQAGTGRVEGIASRVRIDTEGSGRVLRFVVDTDDGRRVPVEMRGREVLGVLDDGDRVRFAAAHTASGTACPRRVDNLTTAAAVEVPAAGRLDRVSGAVGLRDVRTALISALVTVGVGSLVDVFKTGAANENEPVNPRPIPPQAASSSHWAWWVVGGIAVAAALVVAGVWIVRRRSSREQGRDTVPQPPAPAPAAPRSPRFRGRRLAAIAAGVVLGSVGFLLLN